MADYARIHQHGSYDAITQLPELAQPGKGKAAIPSDIVVGKVGSTTFIKAQDVHRLPPIEWLLENEIPHRALTVLYGQPGSGKSFYAIDVCLRVAQQGTAVYIAGEGELGLQYRIAAWTRHYSKSEGHLLLGLGALNLVDHTDQLISLLSVYEPKLIVIDTLARSMGSLDENTARDMNKFVEQCNVLIDALAAPS